MFIDSHSHLHFPVYKEDINAVLGRMKERNVVAITVGTSYKNSLDAVEFSKKYNIPCSVGFHPSHARPVGVAGYLDPTEEVYDEEFEVGKLRELLKSNPPQPDATSGHPSVGGESKNPLLRGVAESRGVSEGFRGSVVAVGECGLDYFRLPEDESLKKRFKQKQREAFEAQIELAEEFNLPLIIHTRTSKEDPNDAYKDTYDILGNFTFHGRQDLAHVGTRRGASLRTGAMVGVMHCFLGSKDWAKKFLDLGFMLSFSGIITFKKADTIRESARYCPKDLILTETDCPYLAPEPFRGERNEPAYVEFILRKLEEIHGELLGEVIEENTQRLFLLNYKNIPRPTR